MNRRDFLKAAGVATTAAASALGEQSSQQPVLCFFSKHLPDLNYDELGRTLKDAGFDGVDLTVRKGGHVLPERAREDLPRAVEAIQSHGVRVPMITTELTSASDPAARPILETAARLKIPFFKLGYWRYEKDVLASLHNAGAGVRGLTDLAKEYGIVAGFHNHPRNVGLAFWDTHEIIRDLDPKWIGYYYDANNATEEGAIRGWEVGLRLASPRLKMAACKDFYWERSTGQSKPVECPLGEGVVNWPVIFKLFAAAEFAGPISIHQEYKPADRIAAAHKDLEFVKKQLTTARSA
jgi:L-ribulose-5-phosphate 3-epimerase